MSTAGPTSWVGEIQNVSWGDFSAKGVQGAILAKIQWVYEKSRLTVRFIDQATFCPG